MTDNSCSGTTDEANRRNALRPEPTFLQFLQALLQEYASQPDAAARAAVATDEEIGLARLWASEIQAGHSDEPDSIQAAIGCVWFLRPSGDSNLFAGFQLFEAYELSLYRELKSHKIDRESGAPKGDAEVVS